MGGRGGRAGTGGIRTGMRQKSAMQAGGVERVEGEGVGCELGVWSGGAMVGGWLAQVREVCEGGFQLVQLVDGYLYLPWK